MPPLSEYKETYRRLSGKCSDACRNLAFAGIALTWVFKIEAQPVPKIPDRLILPCGLLVLTLFFDLMQYFVGSIAWGLFYRYREKKLYKDSNSKPINEEINIDAPKWLPWFQLSFYYLKVATVLLAYLFIFIYICKLWI